MKTLLEAVLDLTDRVQAAIDAGDWGQANELETARRSQLEKLLLAGAGALPQGALDAVAQRTHALIGRVEHHRRRVLREATTVKTGHAAAARYAEQFADR